MIRFLVTQPSLLWLACFIFSPFSAFQFVGFGLIAVVTLAVVYMRRRRNNIHVLRVPQDEQASNSNQLQSVYDLSDWDEVDYVLQKTRNTYA